MKINFIERKECQLYIKLRHERISYKDEKALFPINVFKFAKAYTNTDF